MKLNLLLKMTLICTLTVILLGAYTRLSDAGLGCPDWPGCYGHIKVLLRPMNWLMSNATFRDKK